MTATLQAAATVLKRTISIAAWLTIGMVPGLPGNLAAAQGHAPDNEYWWPNRLKLDPLRQHSGASAPPGEDFCYTPHKLTQFVRFMGRCRFVVPQVDSRTSTPRYNQQRPP